jgi:hypothetical protein
MKYQITVTFRNGEAVQSHTYEAETLCPICAEIRFPSDKRLESVALFEVLSIIITPRP